MAKQSITIRLDAPMLEAIDRVRSKERRTRTNAIEVLLEVALGDELPERNGHSRLTPAKTRTKS